MSKSWKVVFQFQRNFRNICETAVKSVLKMPYYAVARGRSVGIYSTWGECEAQVKGFSGARYKKFDTPQSAQQFVSAEGGSISAPKRTYNNSNADYYSRAGPSYHNLKRSYSSTSTSFESDDEETGKLLSKELDKLEKNVDKFGKGLDKIIEKKGGVGSSRQAIMIEPENKRSRLYHNMDFRKDNDGFVQVYTDGACSSNGRKGARAGLGVYWGDGHRLNTSEPVSGRATNNCGEIQAATRAIRQAIDNGITKISINTDSKFLIDSVTKWMPGWKRKGWKLQSGEPVKNEIDFKELDQLQNKIKVKWNHVEAHKGIHGNEMADQLAKEGAAKYNQ